MEINFVKRIRPENNVPEKLPPENVYTISEWESLHFYNDKVVMHTSTYQDIFGTRKDEKYQYKKRIVKISSNDGRRIYRQFFGQSKIKGSEAAMTSLSFNELGIESGEVNLSLKRTSKFWGKLWYFWYHPYIEVRIPVKYTLISLLVGLIALIIALISIYVPFFLESNQ